MSEHEESSSTAEKELSFEEFASSKKTLLSLSCFKCNGVICYSRHMIPKPNNVFCYFCGEDIRSAFRWDLSKIYSAEHRSKNSRVYVEGASSKFTRMMCLGCDNVLCSSVHIISIASAPHCVFCRINIEFRFILNFVYSD